jgi:hypothetical protein
MVMKQNSLPFTLMPHPYLIMITLTGSTLKINLTQPLLTIGQALSLKDSTEDEIINKFICEPSSVTPEIYIQLTVIMESDNPEDFDSASPPQTLKPSPPKAYQLKSNLAKH